MDVLGREAVHIAAEVGQMESLRFLFGLGVSPETGTREGGMRAAHFAAKVSKPSIKTFSNKLTLQPEMCCNLKCLSSFQEGHVEVLSLLKELNAELSPAEGRFGRTPLHLAAIANQRAVLDFLLRNCPDRASIRCFAGKLPSDYLSLT